MGVGEGGEMERWKMAVRGDIREVMRRFACWGDEESRGEV